jgi:hypothetical protein
MKLGLKASMSHRNLTRFEVRRLSSDRKRIIANRTLHLHVNRAIAVKFSRRKWLNYEHKVQNRREFDEFFHSAFTAELRQDNIIAPGGGKDI